LSEGGETRFRVTEVSPVTEEALERVLNERAEDGYSFESIHFVMREGSHRPAMAYLFFAAGGAGRKRPDR